MSLVQEALIGVLNRRFINCYYNSFPSIGHDAKAAEFADKLRKQGKSLRYGAIITPDGELVVSFGFDLPGFYKAITTSLEKHPEYDRLSDEEQEIIARAEADPLDADAQFALATLYGELLKFDQARQTLERLIKRTEDQDVLARARYLKGHLTLIDPGNQDAEGVRRAFARMPAVPADLEDDVALDRMTLDIELKPGQGFFTGWRFNEKRDIPATIAELKRRIQQTPDSNRIGQMRFYLGLAHIAAKDKNAADEAWETHYTQHPDDRYAMLSRIHHSSYVFSPYGKGGRSVVRMGGPGEDPETAKLLKKLAEQGAKNGKGGGIFTTSVIMTDGKEVTGPEKQKLLKLVLKRMLEQQLNEEEPKDDGLDKKADDKP